MKRSATAVWKGTGKEGVGNVKTQSGVLNHAAYSYHTRFEDGVGTNPEELMAAAHAGCFSMKLAFVLTNAGYTPDEILTDCYIALENGVISKSELIVRAKVKNLDSQKFQECAEEAKINCPVSKAYNCEITLDAALV
ncbi:MAG: OsmC family protein [Bacteroidetes bacterium]|nr:OsmC family protein [Bacteroidota bacterium]MBS1739579.1 OsmC family protein [Bacteroidota bacterium]MBS1776523.1 OsmC family protein [Bacteroidota bacterium]